MPVPTSVIQLYDNVPWNETYNDVVLFPSIEVQNDYFNLMQLYTINNNSYVNGQPDSAERIGGLQYIMVKVGGTSNALTWPKVYALNYMRFQNDKYENKWFYAFIENVEFINQNTARISFLIDVFQTWFIGKSDSFNPFENVFVKRQIVPIDSATQYANTPEVTPQLNYVRDPKREEKINWLNLPNAGRHIQLKAIWNGQFREYMENNPDWYYRNNITENAFPYDLYQIYGAQSALALNSISEFISANNMDVILKLIVTYGDFTRSSENGIVKSTVLTNLPARNLTFTDYSGNTYTAENLKMCAFPYNRLILNTISDQKIYAPQNLSAFQSAGLTYSVIQFYSVYDVVKEINMYIPIYSDDLVNNIVRPELSTPVTCGAEIPFYTDNYASYLGLSNLTQSVFGAMAKIAYERNPNAINTATYNGGGAYNRGFAQSAVGKVLTTEDGGGRAGTIAAGAVNTVTGLGGLIFGGSASAQANSALGASGGYVREIAEQQAALNQGNTPAGEMSSDAANVLAGLTQPKLITEGIFADTARHMDNYFTQNGYTINRILQYPNLYHGTKKYNYVQLQNPIFKTPFNQMPSTAENFLLTLFERGVRLWKPETWEYGVFGNYTDNRTWTPTAAQIQERNQRMNYLRNKGGIIYE